MSVFFEMFVPSRRHVEDERNRLEWTRDEEGQGDPHHGPIDLDSGVVKIKPAGPDGTGAERAVTTPAAPRTPRPGP